MWTNILFPSFCLIQFPKLPNVILLQIGYHWFTKTSGLLCSGQNLTTIMGENLTLNTINVSGVFDVTTETV